MNYEGNQLSSTISILETVIYVIREVNFKYNETCNGASVVTDCSTIRTLILS